MQEAELTKKSIADLRYIAKMMGAKVMLYANGIGPITNENNL